MQKYFTDIDKRNFGLDLFRVIAIIIVVFGHSFDFFPLFQNIDIVLVDGVDLFFVLSGFLIGKILLSTVTKNQGFNIRDLIQFLKRRLLRTLPNYYLFLIINILLVWFGVYDGLLNHNIAAYFMFLQNFYIPLDLLFWESWSLAVEEWFYLIFPVLLLVAFGVFGKRIKFKKIFVSVVLILTPLFLRFLRFDNDLVGHFSTVNWDLFFRKIVLLRLDSIAYGVLGSYVFLNFSHVFFKFKWILFGIGIIGLVLLKFSNFSCASLFYQTFFFSLQSIFILFLIPSFYKIKVKNRFVIKSVGILSVVSYSTYLLHLPVLYVLRKSGILTNSSDFTQIVTLIFYLIVVLTLSIVIYQLWELPITRLREKKFFGL